MQTLIAELEVATEGSRELDRRVLLASGWRIDADGYWWARNGNLGFHGRKEIHLLPQPTTSLDAALTLLPDTACNHHLFSFGGHGVEISGFPETAWGFGFSDTAQLMGERAAKEKIERMSHLLGWGDFSGPPWITMEKAIAEHFIEFNCPCAATPALAVCIAAHKARQAMEEDG